MTNQTKLHSIKLLSLAIIAAITIIIGAGISVSAQNEFRGYKVGRYEGDIINTTGNVKGTAAFEVRKIDRATGEVTTYLTPTSSNLTGEGTLSGKIDENGVLRVSGPFSGWTASVVARVSGNTIKANYRLSSGSSSQDGNFTVKMTTAGNEADDIPVPDAPENDAQANNQTNTTTAMAQRTTKNTSPPKVTGQKSTNVSPKGAPTQADVEKAITDTFKENYKEPWMTSTDVIKVEFSELMIAPRTKRMGIQSSSKYDTGTFVYPVRVKVKVSVDRGRNGIDVKERGVSKYDSFFFYKDEFGTWTFKTGAL